MCNLLAMREEYSILMVAASSVCLPDKAQGLQERMAFANTLIFRAAAFKIKLIICYYNANPIRTHFVLFFIIIFI